jgi:general secretion pathway protein M
MAMPREKSRQAALALLVAAIAALVAVVAVPVYLRHKHYDAAIADLTDKLGRYQRLAATRPDVARSLDAVRAKDARKFFLKQSGPALAAAEVQEAIRQLIESSGGRLVGIGTPAAKDEGRYRQITVNVQFTANIGAVRRILHTVESGTPYIFVENLMIRSQVNANHKPQPGQEPEMFVTFDAHGYALTGA